MNKMFKVLTVVALASTATFALADEKVVTEDGVTSYSTFKPAQVRAEVGTTGYGAAMSWNVNPKTAVTVGYDGGHISWNPDVSVDGTKYDTKLKNSKNAYVNIEYRPMANWFYVAGGVGYLDLNSSLTKDHGSEGVESYNYKYDNTVAPYVGIGVSPSITDRFGLFGEIGTYYTGNPTASDNGSTYSGSETHLNDLNNSNKYKWFPVAKVGVSYRF